MSEEIFVDLQNYILKYLSYKPRTEYEVKQKSLNFLRPFEEVSAEEKENLISEAIKRLQEIGYIDDLDYAVSYIEEQKKKSKPKGPHYVTQFLRKKGVPKQICEKALNFHYSFEDEKNLIQKNIEKYNSDDPAKIIHYLRQRGFNYNTICTFVDRKLKRN